MKKSSFLSIVPSFILLLFALSVAAFYYVFIGHFTNLTYCLVVVSIGLEFFFMPLTVLLIAGKSKKSAVIRSVIAALAGLAVVLPLTYLFNNILVIGNAQTSLIVLNISFITIIVPYVIHLVKIKSERGSVKVITAIIALLCAAVMLTGSYKLAILPIYYKSYNKTVAAPTGMSKYTEKDIKLVTNADFYVSALGSDNNNGSYNAPFATIEKARDTVRTLDKTNKTGITVAVMAGEYRVSGLKFSAEDSGTAECPVTYCAYGDGEVILNGGITLPNESFAPVTDETMLSRLSDDARKNVLCADLNALGLTAHDWGKIYAIGSYNTAEKYDGDYVGELYCELFVNDTRMKLARYPDDGFLKTGDVVKSGYGLESDGALTTAENWGTAKNPESDIYTVDAELKSRITSWKTLDDVWMFGFWKYTWADASSPIGFFNANALQISPKFVSRYGAIKDAPYYFFNIFEELTVPGEWYLDRTSGILYMYPEATDKNRQIDLSLTSDNIIQINKADNIRFEGITIKCTRGDAVSITGNSNSINRCLIKNVSGWAVIVNGSKNSITENEITHTGMGGISLTGGDDVTLTPGENIADNNLIHDWSEVYLTYQSAVSLYGVGNTCSHNEIYNSPHEAVTYGGNNHVIEYNLIHDVCLLSDDAGAIYAGRSWRSYGNEIKNNMIYNVGSGEHKPDGIYMDDALSGQTVYGNILINIPKIGIHLGGGRDLEVKNNILINCNDKPFSYDDRAREGAINGGWFNHSSKKDGDMWQALYNSPWQSEIWQEAFPAMNSFSDDFNNTDSPNFVPNPANSNITGNVIINVSGTIGSISDAANRFSNICNNAVFKLSKLDGIFISPENGNYSLNENSLIFDKLPEFEEIPINDIGRY